MLGPTDKQIVGKWWNMSKDKSLHLTDKQLGLADNPMIHDKDPLASDKGNDPFGRQPGKVTVRLEGDPRDVQIWARHLARAAEYKGDNVQRNIVGDGSIFIIHPRAVND